MTSSPTTHYSLRSPASAPPTSSCNAYLTQLLSVATLSPSLSLSSDQLLALESASLLPLTKQSCPKCDSSYHLQSWSHLSDGFTLRCVRSGCRSRLSIRKGSFFEHWKESIPTVLCIISTLAAKCSFTQTAESAGVSEHTVRRIYSDLADKMHSFVQSHPPIWINGDIVEMDETKMKWSDGITKGEWVLGAINRETGECWLEVLEDRKTARMEPLIKRVVKPLTIVMTDALANYPNIIERLKAVHRVINKQQDGFGVVDEVSGIPINVNHCEEMWKDFRHLMEQRNMFRGSTRHHLIGEFMYIKNKHSWIDLIKI